MRSTKYLRAVHHLEWDIALIVVGILTAYCLVRLGFFSSLLSLAEGIELIGAFIAGVFFTSMFTIAAASVALVEIGNASNILSISLAGAAGAVCGDMLLFLFIRDTLVDDLKAISPTKKFKKMLGYFHGGVFRWLGPIVGALLIASPFPDEIGLALMGASKIRTVYMIPLTFLMNFIGIWAIISLGNLL
jgi:hypothetical protein